MEKYCSNVWLNYDWWNWMLEAKRPKTEEVLSIVKTHIQVSSSVFSLSLTHKRYKPIKTFSGVIGAEKMAGLNAGFAAWIALRMAK